MLALTEASFRTLWPSQHRRQTYSQYYAAYLINKAGGMKELAKRYRRDAAELARIFGFRRRTVRRLQKEGRRRHAEAQFIVARLTQF